MKGSKEIWEEVEVPRRMKMYGIKENEAIIAEWHELSDLEEDE